MAQRLVVFYRYRDADNYKQHGHVVLANPTGLSPETLRAALVCAFPKLQSFPDIVAFDPEALGWPTLFFSGHDLAGADVSFHELEGIEPTDEPPNVMGDAEGLLVGPRNLCD